jgi:hypothetical protein
MGKLKTLFFFLVFIFTTNPSWGPIDQKLTSRNGVVSPSSNNKKTLFLKFKNCSYWQIHIFWKQILSLQSKQSFVCTSKVLFLCYSKQNFVIANKTLLVQTKLCSNKQNFVITKILCSNKHFFLICFSSNRNMVLWYFVVITTYTLK